MDTPLVYIVDDDPSVRQLLTHAVGTAWGYRVTAFPDGEALLAERVDPPDLVILDILMEGLSGIEVLTRFKELMPDVPVIILSSQQRVDIAVETMRLGALEYFTKPVDLRRLEYSVRNALEIGTLKSRVRELQDTLVRTVQFDNIVSSSGAMHEALRMVDKARNSRITVLIEGESGTGKEMIARAIHFNGSRKDGPFVVVNCAAIPKDLLESEMFGHEKGAFTGALQRKIGKFEQAHGGSIFLDEIGEMDIALQAKLLRVIQQRQLERVGGEETIEVDVRIISATNRNLKSMSAAGTFREDLYFRLSTFPILLPPLRERKGDVALLTDHFLRQFAAQEEKIGLSISREAHECILAYPWPGNVRELMSTIERAVLLADGDEIRRQDLPAAVAGAAGPGSHAAAGAYVAETSIAPDRTQAGVAGGSREADDILPLEKVKEAAVREALRLTGGALAETARRLGIGRTTLYHLIRKYGIESGA